MPAMTPTQDLEVRASTLVDQARALKVADQQGYDLAAERLLAVADLRREIIAHHAPIKRAAHEAWQQVIAAEKRLLDPVTTAEATYKMKIADYQAEQRWIEEVTRVRAEAEALRLAEQQRELELEQAEAEGATGEEIAAMVNAPLVVAPPRVQPAFQQAKGITTAVTWKGEVTSLAALVKAISEGKADLHLVQANQAGINEKARATRGTLVIPGVRFFSEPVVRAGRR
jgi:hypothetical protein